MPKHNHLTWEAKTSRQNRRFNRLMDRAQIAIGLFALASVALSCANGWIGA